ncbi:MAG: topoisomerase [Cryobacterium sp.]|jgi:DNA topoisomerase-1|nr:topoisomerase [Cryobacterium sp.]
MPRLRRSSTSRPGYTRVRSGRGFSYRDPRGLTVTDPLVRSRLNSLAIPPAWTDVWIAPYPNGHIQAMGTDSAGRRQYIYHPQWREQKDRLKFERALELAASLPGARRQVTRTLRAGGVTKDRALAAAFRMLDTGSLRIGSERYAAEHGSLGLSTLTGAHATITGSVVSLDFPGKSGQPWQSDIDDPDLAEFVRSAQERDPEDRLLSWFDGTEWHGLSAGEINDYVRERTGGNFTAKDFRTLRGTAAAAASLARHGPEKTQRGRASAVAEAMREAASVLGNTPAIARKSYVDPRVVDHYLAGVTLNPARLGSVESELIAMLGQS